MDNFLVKTNGSFEYNFEAQRFEIHDNIIYFYDDEGEVIWVIKDWISIFRLKKNEVSNPDQFYENLEEK